MKVERAQIQVTWAFEMGLAERAQGILDALLPDVLTWSCRRWEQAIAKAKRDGDTPKAALAHTIAMSKRHGVHLFIYIHLIDLKPEEVCVVVSTSRDFVLEAEQDYLDELHATLGAPDGSTLH